MRSHFQLMLIAAATMITAPAFAQERSCTMYQHRDYKGSTMTLRHGQVWIANNDPGYRQTTNGHGFDWDPIYNRQWNDKISSFRLRGGCSVTLYEHWDGRGMRWSTSSSYSYVGGKWNDEASRVECPCR